MLGGVVCVGDMLEASVVCYAQEDIKPADIDAFLLQHFKNVDAKADGGIDLEEFMVFYEKLNVPLPLRLLREATGAAHESRPS